MKDRQRFLVVLALTGLLLGCTATAAIGQGVQDAWRRILYGQTTEEDLVTLFGKPSEVRIFFGDFMSMRQNRGPSDYRLIYPRAPNDSLLVGGPLGEAWDATVSVSPQGRVWRVEWRYLDGLRLHTRTKERSTPISLEQIEGVAGRSPITISKCISAAGELLRGDCGSYQFDVNDLHLFVSYIAPGNDVSVSVESRTRR